MIRRLRTNYTTKQYVIEFFLIIITLFGLYLITAWSSYSPFDNAWAVSSFQNETLNKAGVFGAWCIDILFALFGSLANLIPFIIVISGIILLRHNWQGSLSKSRVFVRIFGFCLFLCGLTALATLILPAENVPFYLPGGVLGAVLVAKLYPVLGLFGLFMLSFCLASVGFILSSGLSLVVLLLDGFRWLTAKYDDEEDRQPEPVLSPDVAVHTVTLEKLEDVVLPQGAQLNPHVHISSDINLLDKRLPQNEMDIISLDNCSTVSPYQNDTITEVNNAQLELSLPDVNVTPIDGYERFYVAETEIVLPQVSVPMQVTSSIDKVGAGNREIPIEDAVDTTETAQLWRQDKSYHRVEPKESAADDLELQAELARQFAAQENARERERLEQIKRLEQEEASVEAKVEYQSYAQHGTLIHPLLQVGTVQREKPVTEFPSLELLESRKGENITVKRNEIEQTSAKIEQQLANFRVKAQVKDVLVGPVVTRYELELEAGIKASKVSGLDNDLARALMFSSIRIAEVIPGKPYIGIETPNNQRLTVGLREVFASKQFSETRATLPLALGKDISGEPVVVDLATMPHLLVAGATGSGKSVGINSMILSLLFKRKPEDVRLIMIDPKVVELSIYDNIPHLLTPVVTDMKKAANALRWCVDEMERRYQLLSALYVRSIEGFNAKIKQAEEMNLPIPNPLWKPGDSMDTLPPALEKLSYVVVIVDEFADLMMVAGKQIEELIARLAQKARAVGIHLILATQRPSVDVITGLIKANIPSRIAFTVSSKIDSRTILDCGGAEALLGRGDMLYSGSGTSELVRIHGAFMSDEDVQRVADDWRARGNPQYLEDIVQSQEDHDEKGGSDIFNDDTDELFDEVVEFVLTTGTTSISAIQRNFKLGFNRAARIVDQMEAQGILSAAVNGKREILAPRQEY